MSVSYHDQNKKLLPAYLGAAVEYYDVALYGFLTPVLVKVFLPTLEPIYAYFTLFFFEIFACLSQCCGAHYFGKIGDIKGRKKALYQSVLGTSCVTFMICTVPTYESHGFIAVLLFILFRCLQSFFLGGEYNGGAIYCLEHSSHLMETEKNTARQKRGFLTPFSKGKVISLYCAFTVLGIFLASLVALSVQLLGSSYFRYAYAISFLLAVLTFKFRMSLKETPDFIRLSTRDLRTQKSYCHSISFCGVIMASLFFGVVYGLPTKIFNALLPIALGLNGSWMMGVNAFFLLVYMVLLLSFGCMVERIGARELMRKAVQLSLFCTLPMMWLLSQNTLSGVLFVKFYFAGVAAAFVVAFHLWANPLFEAHHRYRLISMGYTIGKTLSTLLLACSFLLYEYFHDLLVLGVIIFFLSMVTLKVLYENKFTISV